MKRDEIRVDFLVLKKPAADWMRKREYRWDICFDTTNQCLTDHQFNVLTLNPYNSRSFPPELLSQLDIDVQEETDDSYRSAPRNGRRRDNYERLEVDDYDGESANARKLREQMQRDALVPLGKDSVIDDFDGLLSMKIPTQKRAQVSSNDETALIITNEIVEEAKAFLELPVCISTLFFNKYETCTIGSRATRQSFEIYAREVFLLLLVRSRLREQGSYGKFLPRRG